MTGSRTMLRKDFWSKTASAFVVWRPNCWRKTSRGVGAVYECPKKVRDLCDDANGCGVALSSRYSDV